MDRKLKLFSHIYRIDDNRLVKVVVFETGKTSEQDQAVSGLMISKNGADRHHHHDSGSITMAADCQLSIGHQLTRAHRMKKKKKKTLTFAPLN